MGLTPFWRISPAVAFTDVFDQLIGCFLPLFPFSSLPYKSFLHLQSKLPALESTSKGELPREEHWPDLLGLGEGDETNQRKEDPSFGLQGNFSPWDILSPWRPFQLLYERGHSQLWFCDCIAQVRVPTLPGSGFNT